MAATRQPAQLRQHHLRLHHHRQTGHQHAAPSGAGLRRGHGHLEPVMLWGCHRSSYQWRKNGVPIPGATTSSYGITNATAANVGTYDLWVTNLYGTATSSAVTVGDEISTPRISNLVLDSNPKGPAHNGLNLWCDLACIQHGQRERDAHGGHEFQHQRPSNHRWPGKRTSIPPPAPLCSGCARAAWPIPSATRPHSSTGSVAAAVPPAVAMA